ncbi:MAG: xylose isomerase, partial [Ktedonobacterales bacterium]
ADTEIQALLHEIETTGADEVAAYQGAYTPEKSTALKAATFDRRALGQRGYAYERLDQLTIELLLGVRG